jgi:Leucine-rich repeat (LRR) protein
MFPQVRERVLGPDTLAEGLDVGDGELVTVLFRILPKKPIKYSELAPVRQTVPVVAERGAAARIRQLGGWYTVDDERHVIEVNMVYHETAEKSRYDNTQIDTDEALRSVVDFPKLQRLFLKDGQASDEALASVEKLPELRVLMVWDATGVTDAGIGHLAGLKELQNIHCGKGQIGDDSLAVFGKLPKLERLSLQHNRFTDIGMKNLMELKNLKSLWIGMNATPFTDAVAESLSALSGLEELDLQGSRLSDAATSKLSVLTSLRRLHVGGSETGEPLITDASVESLVKLVKLEYLGVQNTSITEDGFRRLCKLPHLKQLLMSSNRIGPSVVEQLQKDYPAIQFIYSGRTDAE